MVDQDKSPTVAKSLQRVKLYRLKADGKWDDQGTGHVNVGYLERSEDFGLYVFGEEYNETLLVHRIVPQDIYRKQADTIISWRETARSTELALSFQETSGCSLIWDNICAVQGNLDSDCSKKGTFHNINSESWELPAVELSTLPLILKLVSESSVADRFRLTELILKDRDFFPKLIDLFRICEDLENIDGLHMIFHVVKGIIMLNSPQILDRIFGDEYLMDIIGALEHDPGSPCTQNHREFLNKHVVFKEAIPIKDPTVCSKIHQTYRIGYLKDVVLGRTLDEATVANLNSMVHANKTTVILQLKDDNTFIKELFARLRSSSNSQESKRDLVYLLHEFCSLSKSLQMVQQVQFFRDLMNEGIFDIIADVLQSGEKKLILTATDILILTLNLDSNILRSYILRQGTPLLGLLVKGLITDFGEDMNCEFLEILCTLLDSCALSGPQRENIIEIFYENHLGQLIDVIRSSCLGRPATKLEDPAERVSNQKSVTPEVLSNICELLCFCVVRHPFRIRCNFLNDNAVERVLSLTQRKEKHLVIAAVRFVRALLSQRDEHLENYFVENNVLKPVIDAFVANGDRYNLLNSAVLELFEYICKGDVNLLLKHIVDRFWNQLVKFEHFQSLSAFKAKYAQLLEGSAAKVSDPRKRTDEQALDEQEENYFNEDSAEEFTASASHIRKGKSKHHSSDEIGSNCAASSSGSGGLVDYKDDEDDENDRWPMRKTRESSEEEADEGTMESFKRKRKCCTNSAGEHRHRSDKNPKTKHGRAVTTTLRPTLDQTMLPNTIIVRPQVKVKSSPDKRNHDDIESAVSDNPTSTEMRRGTEIAVPRSCSESLHSNVDSKLNGEESPLMPPKSSPEMTVNGP